MANGKVELGDAYKILSGLSAAHVALQRAAITGTGIIKRNQDGTFEAVHPAGVIFEHEKPKIRCLTVVFRGGMKDITALGSYEPRDAKYALEDRTMAEAILVIARYDNGMSQIIKNRFGEIDHDGPAGL